METSDYIRKRFHEEVNKELTDDALEKIYELFDDSTLDLNNPNFEKDEDINEYLDLIIRLSNYAAEDAERNEIISEDLEIIHLLAKEDTSIPTAPIKRLTDNNTNKRLSKEAAQKLAASIDNYCRDILIRANENAENENHEKITIEDVNKSL